MTDALLLASAIINIFLLVALISVSGDRHSLLEQIRWLQQQIELIERERDAQFAGSNAPNSMLVVLLIIAAIGVAIAFLSRRG